MFTPCPNFASAAVACGTVNRWRMWSDFSHRLRAVPFLSEVNLRVEDGRPWLVFFFLHQDGLHGAILTGVPGTAAAETGLGVAVAAIRALDVLRSALDRLFDLADGIDDFLCCADLTSS
jgi:hypothetical protein